jgi:dethiobiotin synthetase
MTGVRPRGVFVTGTDTGVGKTQIAAALAELIRTRGVVVQPRKPVESGCRREGDRYVAADAMSLREAAGLDIPAERICRYALERAVSPERAAMLESLTLTLEDLREACLGCLDEKDFLLVEGAGGFYSPLATGVLNADLAVALALPVLLVTADRLGTIGQTLMTVEAIERRGLVVVGVVLNRLEPPTQPTMDNAADLSRWLGRPLIVTERFALGAPAPGWRALRPALMPLAARLAADFLGGSS